MKVYFAYGEIHGSRIEIQIKNGTRAHFCSHANTFEIPKLFVRRYGGGMEIKMTLEQLKDIKEKTDRGELQSPPDTVYVNNHIHTTYSFSPYSPTAAVWCAMEAGLATAGIMDHDSARQRKSTSHRRKPGTLL